MFIVTKKTISMVSGEVLELEGYDYSGPAYLCKGADEANQQRKDELNMQKQAFATQQQQLALLNSKLSPDLSGTNGFTPDQMATMRSSALNNNALQYNQAGQSVRQALLARGGGDGSAPISGDFTRGLSGLAGMGASANAQALQDIELANATQAQNNKWNAASVLSGNAATLSSPISSTGSNAASALNSYIQAKNTGFASSFMNNLGGTLGAAVGKAAAGGGGFGLGG